MRRRLLRLGSPLVLVVALVFALAGCGGSSDSGATADQQATSSSPSGTSAAAPEPSGTLRLFSYEDGFDPKYIDAFRKKYPDVDLKTASFGSNDEAVAKIQAGFQADVVNSCVDEASLDMVHRGIYQPLDVSRLEHWNDIFPSMKTLPGVQVDGKVYVLPVDAGTAGIMYNADVVTTAPDSWSDLFDPQWKGRASMENNSTTAIDVGALASGIENPLEMDEAQLQQVTSFLKDHKDQFRTFYKNDSDINSLFKSGEVVISSGYPGNAKDLRAAGMNVKFAVAKEGQMLWACGYGISAHADNVDAAYALLNWYTSVPAELYEAKRWNYMVANQKILDAASPSLVKQASLDAPLSMSNAIPASPPKNKAAWVAAWTEVKAS